LRIYDDIFVIIILIRNNLFYFKIVKALMKTSCLLPVGSLIFSILFCDTRKLFDILIIVFIGMSNWRSNKISYLQIETKIFRCIVNGFCRGESESVDSKRWLHQLKLFFRFRCLGTYFMRSDGCISRLGHIAMVLHTLYIIEYLFRVDKALSAKIGGWFAKQAFS